MAEPIRYDVPAEDPAQRQRDDAYAELDRLVLLLHEHQVLRLACDSTVALADMARILTTELDNDEGKRGLQNLYVLMRALGKLPPQELQRITEAAGHGFAEIARDAPDDKPYPPGIRGVFQLLHDEHLWQALGPALEGIKAFTAHLQAADHPRRE